MTDHRTSRLPGFHRLSLPERRQEVAKWLRSGDLAPLETGGLTADLADRMVENAVGSIAIPIGVATNFRINGRDVLIPMAVEEPSVIAAASHAARMVRPGGGFTACIGDSFTVAQVELLEPRAPAQILLDHREQILSVANATQPHLVSLGGGMRDLEVRTGVGAASRTVVHLIVDCRDAMGANMVNTMAEAVTPLLAELSGGRVGLRILTNLADRRLATATCRIDAVHLARRDDSGETVAAGIAAASDFGMADPYRATTHNKGIFNGIDPVLLATGNDWRAVEAGGHAFAARTGQYLPLCTWTFDGIALQGRIEMPMAVGVVGGASRSHPCAAVCLDLMNISSAAQLAEVAICAGMATNLAALAALATEGIQTGHMRLHQRRL